ncbi:MAG: ribonucleoside triphosphate reductase [Puniceicoccales bacterium]|jgi:ribonucleoside-triphosphate reductase|nr:ribonucleoside triphosphate reductase [Puniceicoccales bacterium]
MKALKNFESLSPIGAVRTNTCARERIFAIIADCGKMTGEYTEVEARHLANSVVAERLKNAESLENVDQKTMEIIEDVLIRSPYHLTARTFIVARDREIRKSEITHAADVQRVNEYLSRADWKVRENSNMTYSLQGLNHYLSGTMSQNYWLYEVYDECIREAHQSGAMHIHDLGQISVYCVGWDLGDLLQRGFCGVAGKLEAAPPRHLRTALGQIVNFFYTLQGEAAGAQAFSNFDTLLAPFIRYDRLDFGAVKQALQEFVFNVNVPTRVGFQTPFTNITLDLFCPKHLANEPVIIGGKPQDRPYVDFQKEMDVFNRALFEVLIAGDAKGRVLTFPIPTINITKDFDWDNPNLLGLWEMTGKYGIPYFSNFVNSDMSPEDCRSMCCRLRIDNTQLERRGGGLFGANPLTGSVGVVTLNLPRLAHLAKDEEDFLGQLAGLMDIAKDSLEIKRRRLEELTESNLYPYTTFYLDHIHARLGAYWKNHFSTIGLIGMNEACTNLLGENICGKLGKAFAVRVLDFMRQRILGYQKATGNHYNLEATPAEGTSFRLARKDRIKYPDILVANDINNRERNAAPYYTNSVHVPVNASDDIFEVLDHQDELQTKFTGGTVVHLFLGECISDLSVVKNLIRKITSGYKLPYFSLTPTFSVCPAHGYLAGERDRCPHCDATCEIYSRVVGYLRPVQQWNDGKQSEYKQRKAAHFPQFSKCTNELTCPPTADV